VTTAFISRKEMEVITGSKIRMLEMPLKVFVSSIVMWLILWMRLVRTSRVGRT